MYKPNQSQLNTEMSISNQRKVELRNYLRHARSVLSDKSLKSPNITHEFYRAIRIKQFSREFGPDEDEEMEFLKKLILACAQKYELKIPKIMVKYSWLDDGEAAHVHFESGVWYIEVDDKYCTDDRRLTTIIAHEMSHVVLLGHDIRLEPTLKNEELTDAVAILAGFGTFFHEVCSTEEVIQSEKEEDIYTIKYQTLGYLKREDIEYLLEVKEKISIDRTVARLLPIKLCENLFCSACGAEIRALKRQGTFRVTCPICTNRQVVRIGTIYKGASKIIRFLEMIILWPILRFIDSLRGFS
ncbi:hypothetical protein PY479_17410 [Shewanella sp. A32]|uniref:hypothetical protein n=1 Tax=Shewanella sp. A32 TaxID=3031327 RepID=UPI0023B9C4B9|nr:hypothetical protein [Shewanella sp. A32]MDF0536039.1 hypothetical protein [Shewanella sp. A32]